MAVVPPEEEPMAFYTPNGWAFGRLTDGSVAVTTKDDYVIFDPDTWASIVASVSARGESAHTFWTATRFHAAAA